MVIKQRDYYEVLGVSRDADQAAIKDTFRELTLKFHPDRNKDPEAEEHYKEIAEAYAVLSDPDKRQQYDHRGFSGVSDFSAEDLFGHIDLGDLFGESDFGFGGGSIFDRFFRHGRHRQASKGGDLEIVVHLPLERIASGGEETVRFQRLAPCTGCEGTGAEKGTQPKSCETCGGSGQQVLRNDKQENVFIKQITTCPVCHGMGTVIETPCQLCNGSGKLEKEESLTVNIPKGAEEGMMLRIPGHGLAAAQQGIPPGDLFVIIRSRRDVRFQRQGADLWREETVELVDAVLGTTLMVPTLDGEVEVTIPPGTQPDAVLRLRNKGLPKFGNDSNGDLNLKISVEIPTDLSQDEHQLYKKLQDCRKH